MKKILLLIAFFLPFVVSACCDDKNEPIASEQDPYSDSIRTDSIKFSPYKTLPRALSQAMAVYDDYVLLFNYDNNRASAYLYKLNNGAFLATLSLPNSTFKRPHCNAASFGNVFNSPNSILPLLYVSQWDNDSEHGCLVYDITLSNDKYSVDLVQTILSTSVATATIGAGQTDWVVDPHGYIYSIGYLLNDGAHTEANNKTMIAKYKLPAINDGSVVTFSNADVLDHFDIPIFTYRQDLCFENGRILMLTGMTNSTAARRLVFINPDENSISSLISLDFINEEPEGVGVADGKILIGFREDKVIYHLELVE